MSLVTISTVEASDPPALTASAEQLRAKATALTDEIARQRHALATMRDAWQGAAADAATARAEADLDRQQLTVTRLNTMATALASAGANLGALRTEILAMANQAAMLGAVVDDDGTVTPTAGSMLMTPALAGAYTTALKAMLTQFARIDAATAETLRQAGDPAAPPPAAPPPNIETLKPPEDATDTEVNQWWDRLTDEQRERLVTERPEWIGNLDGVPASYRDRANRNRLDDLAARPNLTADQRATLDAIDQAVNHPDGTPRTDRQLLVVDLDHGAPRVAVAIGDVEKADNVSVFVPGTGGVPYDKVNSGNDLPTYVQQAADLKRRTDEVLSRAKPGETSATIAWLGYDPPDNFAEAGLARYADAAAPDLASFVNGLDSSRDKDPNLTVIGHSYGSVVASEALQRGTAADNVIFTGSPGLETNPLQLYSDPTPEKLNLTEGHVFVQHADNDAVANLGRFGTTIVSDLPGFTDLSTNAENTPFGPTKAASGHSEYFNADTTALYNQAVVVAGVASDANWIREEK
ncbi:alpha/beta hydrolase [Mycobacterium sp. SMC-4]|uniref:alpha/beta hydrolase n=1 Tax=Mycobacterium sp. SMC-4 TaxID=2857059 RepID=UPI003D0353F9